MKGIRFGEKHTFNDWGLMLKEFQIISPPEIQKNMVSVPGRDGQLNLTKSLDGFVHYYRRTITFSFVSIADREHWKGLYSDIQNYLHGEELKIIDDDTKDSYWLGQCEVGEPSYDKKAMYITITVDAYPYKYDIQSSDEKWLWDTFNFEKGVIREYMNLSILGTHEILFYGSKMPVRPTFIVSSDMQIEYNGKTYNLYIGENVIPEIVPVEGENTFIVTGTGTLTIRYRGGSL